MQVSWNFFPQFPLHWAALLLILEEVIVDYQPAFFFPSSLQGFISQYSTRQVPEEPKVCFPKVPGTELAVHHPHCPEDIKHHHFMVTVDRASLELHIPHQFLLAGENNVQHSISPHQLPYSPLLSSLRRSGRLSESGNGLGGKGS